MNRPAFEVVKKPVPDSQGQYVLEGGLLQCGELDFLNGKFIQTGGTNSSTRIALPLLDYCRGEYSLFGGTLISSNVALGALMNPSTPSGSADFFQYGGLHLNTAMQLYGEVRRQAVTPYGVYTLSGGQLRSDALQVIGGAFKQLGGTNQTQELTLDQAGAYNHVPWSGLLYILNWNHEVNGAGDHVFVGTSGQALTATQLAQIRFLNPVGSPLGTYSARILSNGELVPVSRPPLALSGTGGKLVLSRSGNYELMTSTNVVGPYVLVPGAVSPFTNTYANPERYFILKTP